MGRALASLLMLLVVAGCATSGRVYDRDASDGFVLGVTTADQAIDALGEPDMDLVRPDNGMRILRWRYRKLRGLSVTQYSLGANFDRSGKLVYLHNPADGQVIAPF